MYKAVYKYMRILIIITFGKSNDSKALLETTVPLWGSARNLFPCSVPQLIGCNARSSLGKLGAYSGAIYNLKFHQQRARTHRWIETWATSSTARIDYCNFLHYTIPSRLGNSRRFVHKIKGDLRDRKHFARLLFDRDYTFDVVLRRENRCSSGAAALSRGFHASVARRLRISTISGISARRSSVGSVGHA